MLTSLPIVGHFYWLFETSYFSGLGIDPEIFNRPIFSSNTLNTTLFLISLFPVVKMVSWLIIVTVLIIVVMVLINTFLRGFVINRCGCLINIDRYLDRAGFNSEWMFWLLSIFIGLGTIFSLIGLYAVTAEFVKGKGYEIAERRMSSFLKEDVECTDSWSSKISGCYMIDGVEGKDHMVVLNNDTHIVYFSRESYVNKYGVLTVVPRLFIKEKSSDARYELSRKYKVYKPTIKSE
jgi:hypothetical protein